MTEMYCFLRLQKDSLTTMVENNHRKTPFVGTQTGAKNNLNIYFRYILLIIIMLYQFPVFNLGMEIK